MFDLLKADRNTTIFGLLTFLALAFNQVKLMFDALPDTNPDWSLIVSGLFIFLGLLRAKDAGPEGNKKMLHDRK